MRWIAKIRLRVRSLVQRARVNRELDEELQFHLDQQIEYHVARGMPLADAKVQAARDPISIPGAAAAPGY